MKKKTKIILFLVVIVIMALSYLDIIGKTTAIILFSLGLLYYLSSIVQKVESVFDELGIDLKENDIRRIMPVSYKLNVSIGVDWAGVIRTCFPELKDNESAWAFANKLYEDQELAINQELSLYQQTNFIFTMFRDGISGLEQVWSRHHNTFVDELLVRGRVFDCSMSTLDEKFKNNLISKYIFISPSYIAFENVLPVPDSTPEEKDKISKIPFWEIFYEIVRFHRSKKSADDTLEFPDKLKKEMLKLGATFDMDYSFRENGYIYSVKGKLHQVNFSVNFFGV